jgi:N-dimethylarginine dimethylaminohydrolase
MESAPLLGLSTVGRLRTALLRSPPGRNPQNWHDLGYLHEPDPEKAMREHAALAEALRQDGVDVRILPSIRGNPDCIFVFDNATMTDHGALLLSMRREHRRREVDALAGCLSEHSIPLLGRLESPATAEGGDLLWLDEHTLAVGRGFRTNASGIEGLRRILGRSGIRIVEVPLPYHLGPDVCLHLLTLISPVDVGTAVVHRRLLPVPFVEFLQDGGWNLLDVPEKEADRHACNLIVLRPGRVIALEGNGATRSVLEREGIDVIEVPGEEIMINRTAGPTCLVLPTQRDKP